jgi:hypothetical protein
MLLSVLVAFHTARLGKSVAGNGGNGVKAQLDTSVVVIIVSVGSKFKGALGI